MDGYVEGNPCPRKEEDTKEAPEKDEEEKIVVES
jgi:hypothetical protein